MRASGISLQPLVPPILWMCNNLWLCELWFRAHPLFLITFLGGNNLQTLEYPSILMGSHPMNHDAEQVLIVHTFYLDLPLMSFPVLHVLTCTPRGVTVEEVDDEFCVYINTFICSVLTIFMSDVLSSLSTNLLTSIVMEGPFNESGLCHCGHNRCKAFLYSILSTEIAQGEHVSFFFLCVCWLIVILSLLLSPSLVCKLGMYLYSLPHLLLAVN
jgi:hypothetical protein